MAKKTCEPCSHPQAEWKPGERFVMGNVTEAACCTVHGRGTCGSPLHVHYCPLHEAAPDLLASCKELVADLLSHASLGLNEREVTMLRRAESAIAKAECK